MLPIPIIRDLCNKKPIIARKHKNVSVLFSDIVGFTKISSQCKPEEVFGMLNKLYTLFDQLVDKHNVYKVETIGDAYMVVNGIHNVDSSANNVIGITNMAIDMLNAASNVKSPVDGTPLVVRLGIHCGDVIAGIVGKKMPRYCLFGDTVNTAARMQTASEPGKITVSSFVCDILKTIPNNPFILVRREPLDIKGKGTTVTYFLSKNTVKSHESSKSITLPMSIVVDETTDINVMSYMHPNKIILDSPKDINYNIRTHSIIDSKNNLLTLVKPSNTIITPRYIDKRNSAPIINPTNIITISNSAQDIDIPNVSHLPINNLVNDTNNNNNIINKSSCCLIC